MNGQDPNLEPLNRWAEQVIYETYVDQQPALVEEMRKLIKAGHTPTSIEKFVKSKIPARSQVADHVYLIASFLFRRQQSPN